MTEMASFEERVAFEERVSANADALIALGLKEWRKMHKRGYTLRMSQEEQLRRAEAALLEDSGAKENPYGT